MGIEVAHQNPKDLPKKKNTDKQLPPCHPPEQSGLSPLGVGGNGDLG